jgi:hypothetical protein
VALITRPVDRKDRGEHVARSLYDKVAKHTGFVIYVSELGPDP